MERNQDCLLPHLTAHGLGRADFIPLHPSSILMPLFTRFRLRWARWFSFLTAICAVGYWAERNYHRQSVSKSAKADNSRPLELEPTLLQAQDVTTTALPVASKSKSSWDLEPQWRTELSGSIGERSRQAAKELTPQSSIPETFPLPPRFKKGPPAIGNAIVDYRDSLKPTANHEPIRQPAPTSIAGTHEASKPVSSPSFSPFGNGISSSLAQSNLSSTPSWNLPGSKTASTAEPSSHGSMPGQVAFDRSNLAVTSSNPRSVTTTTRFDSEPTWPDHSFSGIAPAPPQVASPFDVATPNLLTNARMQPSHAPTAATQPSNQTPSFRPHLNSPNDSQSKPSSAHYIRQPTR